MYAINHQIERTGTAEAVVMAAVGLGGHRRVTEHREAAAWGGEAAEAECGGMTAACAAGSGYAACTPRKCPTGSGGTSRWPSPHGLASFLLVFPAHCDRSSSWAGPWSCRRLVHCLAVVLCCPLDTRAHKGLSSLIWSILNPFVIMRYFWEQVGQLVTGLSNKRAPGSLPSFFHLKASFYFLF